jgi:hypothetical protein
MSSSKMKLTLSDNVIEAFYSHFGGDANLSVTVNSLLTMLLEEAELDDTTELDDVMETMREKLA